MRRRSRRRSPFRSARRALRGRKIRAPRALANIETQLKYVFYQNPEHEFIIAGATSDRMGRDRQSGERVAAVRSVHDGDAETLYRQGLRRSAEAIGCGRSRSPARSIIRCRRPPINAIDGSQNPTVLTYGATPAIQPALRELLRSSAAGSFSAGSFRPSRASSARRSRTPGRRSRVNGCMKRRASSAPRSITSANISRLA